MSHDDVTEIDAILPHKERFTALNGGAVSSVVYELARHDRQPESQKIGVFGSPVDTPKEAVHFTALQAKPRFWQSRNLAFAKAYLAHLSDTGRRPCLVEVHGRPQVALAIAKARPDMRVVLYLHNDPRMIRGAKTIKDRQILAQHLCAIISITDYVKSCFLDGLGDEGAYQARHFVNLLGVERLISAPLQKQKTIFMAGRMVPEKGFLEACQGAVSVLQDHPDWQISVAGGKYFAKGAASPYEKAVKDALAPLGRQAQIHGHLPLSDIRDRQARAEICVVPSLWQEPGGLTVLEALAAASALITTANGGIPEFANGRALMVTDQSAGGFGKAMRSLIEDESARQKLQKTAFADFPFTSERMRLEAMRIRDEILR
ncbi:MAG: glycosyltransferase family 4 protein [Candidatus Puniceispirillaceae bacterium]